MVRNHAARSMRSQPRVTRTGDGLSQCRRGRLHELVEYIEHIAARKAGHACSKLRLIMTNYSIYFTGKISSRATQTIPVTTATTITADCL